MMSDDDRRVYQCDRCGYRCNFRQNLRRHRKTHEAKSVRCEHCPYTCRLPQHLRRHVRLVHSFNPEEATGPLFVCASCPFATGSAKVMGAHCSRFHDDPKPWRCSRCDYRARSRCIVRYHEEQVHERRRPFRCETCGLAAVSRRVLAIHRVIHSPDPTPYRCDRCTYATRFLSNLTKHMIVHTDAKPFECSQCDMRFARKANLKTHTSKAHRRLEASQVVLPNSDFTSTGNGVGTLVLAETVTLEADWQANASYQPIQQPLIINQNVQLPFNVVLDNVRESTTLEYIHADEHFIEQTLETPANCGEMDYSEGHNDSETPERPSDKKTLINIVGSVTTHTAIAELPVMAPLPTIADGEISCESQDSGISTQQDSGGADSEQGLHEVNCPELTSDYCSRGCETDCLLHNLLAL